jgi:uncharacterized membrane protein YtjA (UPF0391 family)
MNGLKQAPTPTAGRNSRAPTGLRVHIETHIFNYASAFLVITVFSALFGFSAAAAAAAELAKILFLVFLVLFVASIVVGLGL